MNPNGRSFRRAKPFGSLQNTGLKEVTFEPRIQSGICRLRFSFFVDDFDLRSRAVPASGLALREGAARAATAGSA
jgi:hypothetical protein